MSPPLNELQLALVQMEFTQETAKYIPNYQGMLLLTECCILMDDEAENLCKVL